LLFWWSSGKMEWDSVTRALVCLVERAPTPPCIWEGHLPRGGRPHDVPSPLPSLCGWRLHSHPLKSHLSKWTLH
jgi:hypothetical protein